MARLRLDNLLLKRHLAESSQQAQGLIMAGKVWVNNQRLTQSGTRLPSDVSIRLSEEHCPWVSRGGIKLSHALDVFDISPQGARCLDVGASTGGFTEVLLDRGARQVYALDVGYGQLAWKLVQDGRVVVLDRVNIRQMDTNLIPEPVDFLTMDVSFIGLSKALPPALHFLRPQGCGIVLLKPQFELARERITKGGIVQDPALHQEALDLFKNSAKKLGLEILGWTPSPVTGSKGNREFLFGFRRHHPIFTSTKVISSS